MAAFGQQKAVLEPWAKAIGTYADEGALKSHAAHTALPEKTVRIPH
jgi:hypothetical protein